MKTTIGFDLDMTLVDSAAGITACMSDSLKAFKIKGITTEQQYKTIGIPLRDAFAQWVEEGKVDEVVAYYRSKFDEIAFPHMKLLPHALEALTACEAHNVEVLVVSSRKQESLEGLLRYLNIIDKFSLVKGGAFGEAKGAILKEAGAAIYVGDHEGDVRGAKAGECFSIAVCTGPSTQESLAAENPDILMKDLSEFGPFLDKYMNEVQARTA